MGSLSAGEREGAVARKEEWRTSGSRWHVVGREQDRRRLGEEVRPCLGGYWARGGSTTLAG